ncbi:MAG: hypothetical protein CSA68_04640 [Rhodobacterales bacterium]|nr:MAG: hypothetical protein CSA68_04640 [Rhodobacterales bacterium]
MTEPKPDRSHDLHADLKALKEEVQRLNNHRFVRIHNSPWRLIRFQFVRGLAFGLGSVIGATFLVSALVYSLSNIDFIPIVGEWAREIASMITTK